MSGVAWLGDGWLLVALPGSRRAEREGGDSQAGSRHTPLSRCSLVRLISHQDSAEMPMEGHCGQWDASLVIATEALLTATDLAGRTRQVDLAIRTTGPWVLSSSHQIVSPNASCTLGRRQGCTATTMDLRGLLIRRTLETRVASQESVILRERALRSQRCMIWHGTSKQTVLGTLNAAGGP
jgi:hypothetical protein